MSDPASTSRQDLLTTLGWEREQGHEGVLRWTKASADMLGTLSYAVRQDAAGVEVTVAKEEVDEAFKPKATSMLTLGFDAGADGRLSLARHVHMGQEQLISGGSELAAGDGAPLNLTTAIELAVRARALFGARPRATLLREMGLGIAPRASRKL